MERGANPCTAPPVLGAPVSPSAILSAVVAMVRRAASVDVDEVACSERTRDVRIMTMISSSARSFNEEFLAMMKKT